jgi:hypothetical protein
MLTVYLYDIYLLLIWHPSFSYLTVRRGIYDHNLHMFSLRRYMTHFPNIEARYMWCSMYILPYRHGLYELRITYATLLTVFIGLYDAGIPTFIWFPLFLCTHDERARGQRPLHRFVWPTDHRPFVWWFVWRTETRMFLRYGPHPLALPRRHTSVCMTYGDPHAFCGTDTTPTCTAARRTGWWGWRAGACWLAGASNSYWKPWAPISLGAFCVENALTLISIDSCSVATRPTIVVNGSCRVATGSVLVVIGLHSVRSCNRSKLLQLVTSNCN